MTDAERHNPDGKLPEPAVKRKGTHRQPPGGSRKGKPNKVTAKAREVIQEVLDGTAPRVQAWLDAVAKDDPKGALSAFTALLEFGVPKLARTELTGKDGGPVVIAASNTDERL